MLCVLAKAQGRPLYIVFQQSVLQIALRKNTCQQLPAVSEQLFRYPSFPYADPTTLTKEDF